MLKSDKVILHKPIDSFQEKGNYQIQHTIRELTPIINISIAAATILGPKFRKINTYFPPLCKSKGKTTCNKSLSGKHTKQNIRKQTKGGIIIN